MRIGKLDQQIIFAALVEANVEGSLIQSWPIDSPPDMVWAEVISQRGGESFEAAKISARETIRIRVRYRDDITNKYRLNWLGQTYSIIYVDRSQRRDGDLWLTAQISLAV